jgi:hypothetical protein
MRTSVRWDDSRTMATIFSLDTFPTADFHASPAYTINAKNTRAVDSLTFDLMTLEGEQSYQLGPENDKIEIHTQKGLCAINTDSIPNHDPQMAVGVNEKPLDTFPIDGSVQISFNRAIDTALMKRYSTSTFAGLEEKESGLKIPCEILFSHSALAITITPNSPLNMGHELYMGQGRTRPVNFRCGRNQ